MPRFAIPVVVLGVAGWLAAAPVRAHAILMDSQPAARASAAPGRAVITLRFNSRIDHARSRLTLRTGQVETILTIQADSAADTLAAVAALRHGDHVIRWQVLAVDGHVTRGDIPFTVQGR